MAAKQIQGLKGMSAGEVNLELRRGGRFVIYQYCISIVILTFRRSSDVYFIRAGESSVGKGLKFTLLTLFLGWWGIPWGPIWSIMTLVTNLKGGKDVTKEVAASFSMPRPAAAGAPAGAAPARA
jgi:hypothetical protein